MNHNPFDDPKGAKALRAIGLATTVWSLLDSFSPEIFFVCKAALVMALFALALDFIRKE